MLHIVRMVADPEPKETAKGVMVTKFRVAFDDPYDKEYTSFFNCVSFGKTAEAMANYFKKGERINIIYCYPKQNRWEDKEGNKRERTEFIVEKFQFVEKKGE